MQQNLTQQRLCEVVDYNPDTGVFVWKTQTGPRAQIGAVAGSINVRKYVDISIDGRKYVAHRLAWLYTYGVWPTWQIDHIDGVRHNNMLSNLRDVPRSINMQNQRKARKGALTGLLGVSRHNTRWRARIQTNGVVHRLGTFDTPEEAHAAYLVAKRQQHIGCTI